MTHPTYIREREGDRELEPRSTAVQLPTCSALLAYQMRFVTWVINHGCAMSNVCLLGALPAPNDPAWDVTAETTTATYERVTVANVKRVVH
eukprot:2141614-Amphidinium_carterae.1